MFAESIQRESLHHKHKIMQDYFSSGAKEFDDKFVEKLFLLADKDP
jgi:hypothetical protein